MNDLKMNAAIKDAASNNQAVRIAVDAGDVWVQDGAVSIDVTTGKSDWHFGRGAAAAYLEGVGLPVRYV